VSGLARLWCEPTVLLDGGMGSALIARGPTGGGCSELWNVERPDDVLAVHAGYLAAGSVAIQTNTFGGSAPALDSHGLAREMEALNHAGARIARRAVEEHGGGGRIVAGNIGPSGRFLPPVGDADPDELADAFAAQAAALAVAGVDYVAIETMIDIEEALCALRGARRATDLPVTVCLTFEKRPRGFFTVMGNALQEATQILADAGADAVGANCSIGSDAMLEACSLLCAASPVPVIAKPNAGLPEVKDGRPVYRQTPQDFARDVAAMAGLGVRAVGGCCGTDESFIAALAKELARDLPGSQKGRSS
jgi:methionine synthase I (cobalamin-dependent)